MHANDRRAALWKLLQPATVEEHVAHILAKAAAGNRTDLAIRALQLSKRFP